MKLHVGKVRDSYTQTQFFFNNDFNNALYLGKLFGIYPFNVAGSKVSTNFWCVTVMIVRYFLLVAVEVCYLWNKLQERTPGKDYQLVIHIFEFLINIPTAVATTVSLFRQRKIKALLGVMTQIQASFYQLEGNKQPKKFSYSTSVKLLHLIPLYIVLVNEFLNFKSATIVEFAIAMFQYSENIHIFTFILVYSIHVAWISHVFDQLENIRKIDVIKAGIICNIEDDIQLLCEFVNDIFAPALLCTVLKHFILISDNIYWVVTLTDERVKFTQLVWVLEFISLIVFCFNGPESCLRKAMKWDWTFYRLLKIDTNDCIENPKIYLHNVNKQKVRFNVAGFFDMSYSFLGTMIVGSLTFVVLLPQILSPIALPSSTGQNEIRQL